MEDNMDYLACQQTLNQFLTDALPSSENQHEVLMIRHVFKFIHKNFENLNQKIQMADILPILHHSLRLEVQKGNELHVGSYVLVLLNLHDKDDEALNRCLQILYQILSTLSAEDTQHIQIGNEVLFKLIEILLSNSSSPNNASILACLQLYSNKFNGIEVIMQLWTTIKDNLNSNQIIENTALLQTLIHFFDEFSQHVKDCKESTDFTQLVQRLLNSDNHDNRKSAYFLLKKAHLLMEEQMKSRIVVPQEQDIKRRINFWSILICNFENLEENQSHLILPSLEQLRNLNISNLTEQFWLDILYRQILRHNNILVRRWILEYLLENLTYFSMTSETQAQLMLALNDTSLYNVEGYMLPAKDIYRFLNCDKSNFLLPFSRIEWKAVPLHYWLEHLISNWKVMHQTDVSHEMLVSLATKIRAMQNVSLRRENIKLFNKLFFKAIDDMELVKYVQLVEALYNVSDPYEDKVIFFKKVKNCQQHNLEGNRIFTLRFYNILTNSFLPDACDFLNLSSTIEHKIEQNNWRPGFLRFIIIFHSYRCSSSRKFCKTRYDIDTVWFGSETPLNRMYEYCCAKLASTKEEENLVKQNVTDCYVQSRISEYNDVISNKCNVEELLNAGSSKTLKRLTDLLALHTPFVGKAIFTCFVESLRSHLKNDQLSALICGNLMKHCERNLNNKELGYYGEMLLDLDLSFVMFDSVTLNFQSALFSLTFLIENALLANTKVGDSRIEEAYECVKLQRQAKLRRIRVSYTKLLNLIPDENKKEALGILYEKIQNINCKRPRYYANSKEHRSITHILAVILVLLPKTNVDSENFSQLWKFLMEHNNQQNITILYQIAIANIISWQEIFSKVKEQLKASTCTPSQELSMIVILYRCYKLKCKFENITDFENLIYLLWPLTMGANFQTRLYSQLAISRLLDEYQSINCAWYSIALPKTILKLGDTIKTTLTDEQIVKFNEDIRFMEVDIEDAFEHVMDFTNAPYDEYDFISYKRFQKRNTKSEHENQPSSNTAVAVNLDVQRKLNPVADFMPLSDLSSYPEMKEKMLYVVASLIDKIPNLGGIARTCEVLGIKNLVIDSKAHITKADFKNLSMTAEKCLNIVEVKPSMLKDFILKKKTEGFKVVGAEQTANSCSFVNFNFPKRTVLLLGHEKEGIPPNLLGFLDYAVEIPQFGMVRSLNVHVTGAIFMWEYCKQHIVRN